MYGLYLVNEDGKEVYTPDSEREFNTYDEALIRLREIENDAGYANDHNEHYIVGYIE